MEVENLMLQYIKNINNEFLIIYNVNWIIVAIS